MKYADHLYDNMEIREYDTVKFRGKISYSMSSYNKDESILSKLLNVF